MEKAEKKSLSKRKKIFFVFVASLILSIALIVVVEVGVRIFAPQSLHTTPQYLCINDSDIGYRLNPGFVGTYSSKEFSATVRVNSMGLRGEELLSKKENEYRILALGRSGTLALEIENIDTHLKILEKELNKSPLNSSFLTVNAGGLGYGTEHELGFLKKIGDQVEPDMLLLEFSGMDINENLISYNVGNLAYRTVKDGHLVTVEEGGRTLRLPNFIRYPLRKYSQSYMLIKKLAHGFLNRFRKKTGPLLYAKEYDQEFEKGWEYTLRLIDEMNIWCKQRDVKFVIMFLADRDQIYPSYFDSYKVDIENYDIEKPNKIIKSYCDKNSIPFFDNLNDLRNSYNESGIENLFFISDNHMNENGNEVTGVALSKFLLNSQIIENENDNMKKLK